MKSSQFSAQLLPLLQSSTSCIQHPCNPSMPFLCPTPSHWQTPVFSLSIAQRGENLWTKNSKQLKHLGAMYIMTGCSPSMGSSRVSFWSWQKLQELSISEILSLTSFAKFDWGDAADGKEEGQVEERRNLGRDWQAELSHHLCFDRTTDYHCQPTLKTLCL